MSLTLVVNGNNVNATDINQVINVLQQPSGGQEKGHYFCGGNSYATNGYITIYMPSISRGSAPVSVTIDASDVAASNVNSPSTQHLSANGFEVYTTSLGPAGAGNVAGKYTIQF